MNNNNNEYKTVNELIKLSIDEKAKRDKDINIEQSWEKFYNKYYKYKEKKL